MRTEKTNTPAIQMDDVTRRLQTRKGKEMLQQVMQGLSESIASVDFFEPGMGIKPKGKLEKLIFEELSSSFSPSSQASLELPAAVTRALQRFVDESGSVSPGEVQKQLGPAGFQFLDRLAKIDDPAQVTALHDRRRLDRLGFTKLEALAVTDVEVPKMRALDAMAKEFGQAGELEGLKFFGLQHLFVSSVGMFDGLAEMGIKHEDMRVLGKIYSTNFAAAAHLENRGASVDGVSKRLIPGKTFEHSMNTAIEENLRALIDKLPRPPEANPKPQILLIDDGADAIKLLHDKFPEYAPYFIGVEQTRRGARILHDLDLKCPVVNVAESWAKLEWESPMIGHSVVLEVGTKLDRLEAHGISTGQEAVVLGYGAVGQAVAKSLTERGFEVHIYDPSPKRQALAEKDGMVPHTSKEEVLPHAQTLVSCVGRRTLMKDDHDLLPDGAILVNAASADDELGPDALTPLAARETHRDEDGDLWTNFQGRPVNLGLGEATAHSDWVIRQPSGKELMLVNKGYVVNMTGDRDPIPPRFIQLTRSLLFLGALAAKRADKPGIIDVPEQWQKRLVEVVQSELAETGENLLDPEWQLRDGRPALNLKDPPVEMRRRADPEQEAQARADRLVKELRIEDQLRASMDLPPSGADADKIYGFKMGPVSELSYEAAALAELELSDQEMTPLRAAVFQASKDVGYHFNVHLDASLSSSDETKKVGGGFEVQDEAPADEYLRCYARYALDFVSAQMSRGANRPPQAEKIARHFVQILEQSRIDPDAAIAQLQAALDKDVRVLAQAAYRLRQRA